jgi:hypothetical protein
MIGRRLSQREAKRLLAKFGLRASTLILIVNFQPPAIVDLEKLAKKWAKK